MPGFFLHNQTPHRLHIVGSGGNRLTLAPLERTAELPDEELAPFDLEGLAQRNVLRYRRHEGAPQSDLAQSVFSIFVMAGLLFGFFVLPDASWADATVVFGLSAQAVFWIGFLLLLPALSWAVNALAKRKGEGIRRGALQYGTFGLVLLIAVVVPAYVLDRFSGALFPSGLEPPEAYGALLQLLFLATVSAIPALLYFVFDRQELGTLRDRFEHQIFRLDRTVTNLVEVRAKFGRQVDEIYGPESLGPGLRLSRGSRIPILVATVVITLGWAITLAPIQFEATPSAATTEAAAEEDAAAAATAPARNAAAQTPAAEAGAAQTPAAEAGAAEAGATETTPTETWARFGALFQPRPWTFIFGFLGAYWFALQMIVRRYVRGDLKPKAYTTITVRILTVIILSWALDTIGPSGVAGWDATKLGFAFLVGIMPEVGVRLLKDVVFKTMGFASRKNPAGRPIEERLPLHLVEGIDLYDRARLFDEGITNVEALAHHDLIDLMLATRISVPRLVDWADQSILLLHLADDRGSTADDDRLARKRQVLRDHGIRTASDLLLAHRAASARGGDEERSFLALLDRVAPEEMGTAATGLPVLRVILDALVDDEWLLQIVNWRDEGETRDLWFIAVDEPDVRKNRLARGELRKSLPSGTGALIEEIERTPVEVTVAAAEASGAGEEEEGEEEDQD